MKIRSANLIFFLKNKRKSVLTLPIGVVDPFLFDLRLRRGWFLLDGLLYDAAGVLHGPLFHHTRALLHAAHHDHHEHQQQQQHYHPRKVLVDVKVIVSAWPRRSPPGRPVVVDDLRSTDSTLLASDTCIRSTCVDPILNIVGLSAGTWHSARNRMCLLDFSRLLSCAERWNLRGILIKWSKGRRRAKLQQRL